MQWLAGAATLIVCEFIGRTVSSAFALPVPGSVLGMLLLLCGLLAYGGVPAGLARVSGQLLRFLALLFLPAAVGIFYLPDLRARDWMVLSLATLIGTLLSLLLCAGLLNYLLNRRPSPNISPGRKNE